MRDAGGIAVPMKDDGTPRALVERERGAACRMAPSRGRCPMRRRSLKCDVAPAARSLKSLRHALAASFGAVMNHFLVARRSAIAMLSSEINALDVVNATLPAQMPARAAECRRLIIALRAGRIDDFVLPAEIPVQLTILD
ncbi:hypothetical protein [Burkholderia plantarii]|uniref:hypothetical protein n=1 Tax=Burkholderia plantarii TaxID=41899 RepID=UPI0011DF3B0D|nr:hypothetical protein [Burkholderia plantarii]